MSRDATPQRERRSVDGLAPSPKKHDEGADWSVAEEWHRMDYRFQKFEEEFDQWQEAHPILFRLRRLYLRRCRGPLKKVCCHRKRFFLPYVHFQRPYIQWGDSEHPLMDWTGLW
jgi:hypothetical protein